MQRPAVWAGALSLPSFPQPVTVIMMDANDNFAALLNLRNLCK